MLIKFCFFNSHWNTDAKCGIMLNNKIKAANVCSILALLIWCSVRHLHVHIQSEHVQQLPLVHKHPYAHI